MRVVIVDDEPLALDRLHRMVEKLSGYNVVAKASNGIQAIELANKHEPDIMLLDVRMPGMDGLTAAKKISEMPDPPAIIFCTAYGEYALEAFEAQAVGYLLKPVTLEKLHDSLAKAAKLNKVQLAQLTEGQGLAEKRSGTRNHIAAKTRKGMELIAIDDIRMFLADQKYVTVYHREGETLIDETLKELESEFPSHFLRIHRNALVSLKHIEGLERQGSSQYVVCLEGIDQKPAISRRHVPNVRKQIKGL